MLLSGHLLPAAGRVSAHAFQCCDASADFLLGFNKGSNFNNKKQSFLDHKVFKKIFVIYFCGVRDWASCMLGKLSVTETVSSLKVLFNF